ncbi:Clavaminate synthase-like protein, partial [Mycena latifolia]
QDFPQCITCVHHRKGEGCHFIHVRELVWDGDCVKHTWVQSSMSPTQDLQFPDEWNMPIQLQHIDTTKRTIAVALRDELARDLYSIYQFNPTHRPLDPGVHASCDPCLTSISSLSWLCMSCGCELCRACHEKTKHLCSLDFQDAELQAHVVHEPEFLKCVRNSFHDKETRFVALSSVQRSALSEAIQEMELLISTSPLPLTSVAPAWPSQWLPEDQPPLRPISCIDNRQLTEEEFETFWMQGTPLLVTGIHLFWSPGKLVKLYGDQECISVDCQTQIEEKTTVRQFFQNFTKPRKAGAPSKKLKDWPPSQDFQIHCPELYKEFNEATPVPNYVRWDGVFNISSHFPSNALPPDLGPKMYNTHANFTASDCQGSTHLHMDMADAVNIMTYASPSSNGPSAAAWDLYHAEDSDKLRSFIRRHFLTDKGDPIQGDPIHSQQVYLNDARRQQLWEEEQVRGYCIYQEPRQAIFIPDGCAHQVRNLSNCIKVATDFVSPHNIQRCEKLTREFQVQNIGLPWKEDVLWLKSMLWFAWHSCYQLQQHSESL